MSDLDYEVEWEYASTWKSSYCASGAVAVMNNYSYIRASGGALQRLYKSTEIWKLESILRAGAYNGYVYAFHTTDHKIYQIKDRDGENITEAYDVTTDITNQYHHADFDSISSNSVLLNLVALNDNQIALVLFDSNIIIKIYSKPNSGEELTRICSLTTPITSTYNINNKLHFSKNYLYFQNGTTVNQYAYNGELIAEFTLGGSLWGADYNGNMYYVEVCNIDDNFTDLVAKKTYIKTYDSKGNLITQKRFIGYISTTSLEFLKTLEGAITYSSGSTAYTNFIILLDKNLNDALLTFHVNKDYMPKPICYYNNRVILYDYYGNSSTSSYQEQTVCLKLK